MAVPAKEVEANMNHARVMMNLVLVASKKHHSLNLDKIPSTKLRRRIRRSE
jgi:hypothetical protein